MAIRSSPLRPTGGIAFRRGAFTLIEVMLALTLTGVVVGLAGRTAVLTLRTQRSAETHVASQVNLDRIFERLSADFAARLGEPVEITLDANHRPQIRIPCLASYPSDALHVLRLPSRVVYRLIRSDSDASQLRLVRAVYDGTRPNTPPQVTTIGHALEAFDVTIFDGSSFQPVTELTLKQIPEPQALRITCRFAESDAGDGWTFLLAENESGGSQRAAR